MTQSTTRPRPLGRQTVIRQGNSASVTATDIAAESGIEPDTDLLAFVGPDGETVVAVTDPDDPLVDGWESLCGTAIRERSGHSLYLSMRSDIRSALGVEVGDDVEVSAAPGRIMLRRW